MNTDWSVWGHDIRATGFALYHPVTRGPRVLLTCHPVARGAPAKTNVFVVCWLTTVTGVLLTCHPVARGPRKNECFCGVLVDRGIQVNRVLCASTDIIICVAARRVN